MKKLILLSLFVLFFGFANSFAQEELLEEPDAPKTKAEKPKTEKSKKSENLEQLQDGGQKEIPPKLRFLRDKYEETYNNRFEIVWKSVKKAISDLGCMIQKENYHQGDDGLFKGLLWSDMCVFEEGKDSSFKKLEEYSVKAPFIRGAVWTNARIQYKFSIKEKKDGTVFLSLKTELSGFESYVTGAVQFWDESKQEISTGFKENEILTLIKKNIDEASK